jgi:hypothetical protein
MNAAITRDSAFLRKVKMPTIVGSNLAIQISRIFCIPERRHLPPDEDDEDEKGGGEAVGGSHERDRGLLIRENSPPRFSGSRDNVAITLQERGNARLLTYAVHRVFREV